jgi:hypothetical protein
VLDSLSDFGCLAFLPETVLLALPAVAGVPAPARRAARVDPALALGPKSNIIKLNQPQRG